MPSILSSILTAFAWSSLFPPVTTHPFVDHQDGVASHLDRRAGHCDEARAESAIADDRNGASFFAQKVVNGERFAYSAAGAVDLDRQICFCPAIA